jgi:putative toxin-antitoxin system antitoxin component (TIGR02293 family)
LVAVRAGRAEPTNETERVTRLLGGSDALPHPVHTALEVHELLLEGLPGTVLDHLVKGLLVLDKATSLEKAVGMSLRTYQRRQENPGQSLSQEQSGRAWQFAEILARATDLFGSQEEAERWLDRPAMALDGRRPIELLATPAGVGLVTDHLKRLEYGVYA